MNNYNMYGGYWNAEAGNEKSWPSFVGAEEADIAIVGGGLSGMWAALDIADLQPDARVVLLEAKHLGWGPSGRAGGIVYSYWYSLPRLSRLLDPVRARRLAAFSEEMLLDIAALEDIDWQRGGALHISTAPAYDRASDDVCRALRAAGRADLFKKLSPEEVQERIASPRWRGGTLYPQVATVHPGKLVRALAKRLHNSGAQIYEGSEVLEIERQGDLWSLRTPGGTLRAERVLQTTGALGPLARGGVVPSSSHMIVTEPIADIKEFWPGPEAATDERATVRYMRKTADNRIAFGWGFGRAESRQPVFDEKAAEQVSLVFRQFFPELSDTKIDFSWGGPVDISPTHLPLLRQHGPGFWSVAGYTGNGIGPSRTLARMLALHALGQPSDLQLPEPLLPLPQSRALLLAGNITRAALLRKEAALEAGRRPRPLTKLLADLPGWCGIELGR